MNRTTRRLAGGLLAVALGASPAATFGAAITWSTPTAIATGPGNSSDISTAGTLVEAFNGVSTDQPLTSPTINGVPFAGTASIYAESPANAAGADLSSGTNGGDAAYDTMLSSVDYGAPASQTISIGHGALQVGAIYQLQVWYVDDRATTTARVMRFGDGLGHDVLLNDQFVIGTFTADGTSQNLLTEAQGFARAHLNGYQLRLLPSGPPPAPETPVNLVATAGDSRVTLDWADNTQYGFTNFIVRRATTAGGPYTSLPGATPTASTYTDTGLSNGTTYYYVVAARNSLDQVSADSAQASATPEALVPDPPLQPANLTAMAGNHAVTLNWDDNTQSGFLEFRVKRSTTAGGPFTQIATTPNSIYTDTSALNGTTYYYVVTAVNSLNAESAPSEEKQATPAFTATPPNFLFIITDDQDTYSVGAYRRREPAETGPGGQPYVINTPNIDRLAAQGMLFHQARLMGSDSGAVCLPSRTCIMTGKNTWERTAGVSAAVTLPGIFNRGVRNGAASLPYATYRTCKSGNTYATANNEFSIIHDADKRGNIDGSGSEWHADWGISYLDHWNTNHRPNNKPFLIYLGFSHPHDERLARTNPNLTGRYGCLNTTNPGGITLNPLSPPLPYNHLSCTPSTYPAHPFNHGDLNVRDENLVSGFGQYRTEPVVRNEIGRNFACVDWIDQQIGRVIARVEDPNGDGDLSDSVLNNTYIVFTSDHGIAIGRHGLEGKQNLYEHTWRVPYIVRGPGITPGSETDALIYLHDTFPTFCDLAGIDPPSTIDGNDGRSFRNVLQNPAAPARDDLFGVYAGGDKPGIRSITDGRFKIIKYDVANNVTQVTQMFDLETNPFELLPEHGVPNIATLPAYNRIRARLEARMMAARQHNADPYQFLGDRTLLRFEDGPAASPATILQDRFAWNNDGTASGGLFSADVPTSSDRVNGEPNTLSLRLSPGEKVSIPDARALDMGAEPFTFEAYVKLETLPSAGNSIPVISKGTDYRFYAGGGALGNASNGLSLSVGGTTIHSSLVITDRNWHHLSAAVDPATHTVRFVVDGQTQILTANATGAVNTDAVVLGGGAFDGLMDEVSITVGFLAMEELQPIDSSPSGPFRITGWDFSSATDFSLTFESEDTRLYTVQRSATLLPGSWTDVCAFVPGRSGSSTTTIDHLPREPQAGRMFYRVRVAE